MSNKHTDLEMNICLPLTLASNSPRRRELFALLGLPFDVVTAEVDESPVEGESPAEMVRRLSLAKARAVASRADGPALVIGADTTVANDTGQSTSGQVLGKPVDANDARRMLGRLRDCAHQVYTGVALVESFRGADSHTCRARLCPPCEVGIEGGGKLPSPEPEACAWVAASIVWMRPYSDAEIEAYIATGDPFDKAGAYAIQHPVFRPVARVEGCYANVMGLPLCDLIARLKEMNAPVCADARTACSAVTGYQCSCE